MKLLHTLKGGKVNVLDLTTFKFTTRHRVIGMEESIEHEGWVVEGEHELKGHKYGLLFSPEEAKLFYEKLGDMLKRFEANSLSEFVVEETHDDD